MWISCRQTKSTHVLLHAKEALQNALIPPPPFLYSIHLRKTPLGRDRAGGDNKIWMMCVCVFILSKTGNDIATEHEICFSKHIDPTSWFFLLNPPTRNLSTAANILIGTSQMNHIFNLINARRMPTAVPLLISGWMELIHLLPNRPCVCVWTTVVFWAKALRRFGIFHAQ